MKIAIIGGIGSGKSIVIDYLKKLGERTCDCDEIYKRIMVKKDYVDKVGKIFDVVRGGVIDKRALGQIVFSDENQLKKLNSLAHPIVFQWIDNIYKKEESNLYIEVSAFDESMADYFDNIVFIKSSQSQRIKRVKARNRFQEDYILSIMSKQMSEEKMQDIADFVIVNDGNLDELHSQVEWLTQWLNNA